jgi:hypothetical protein
LVAMDRWVENGTEPPASRHPRIDDGTLVNVETFQKQFPQIPLSVDPPPRCWAPAIE